MVAQANKNCSHCKGSGMLTTEAEPEGLWAEHNNKVIKVVVCNHCGELND